VRSWSSAGEILTADHVVQRDEDLNVILPDGSRQAARLLGRDPHSDLALLKVEASDLVMPEFASGARVGHVALALGRPDDLQASVSHVVSIGGRCAGASGIWRLTSRPTSPCSRASRAGRWLTQPGA